MTRGRRPRASKFPRERYDEVVSLVVDKGFTMREIYQIIGLHPNAADRILLRKTGMTVTEIRESRVRREKELRAADTPAGGLV